MALWQRLMLPLDKFRLEEINLLEELGATLAGQVVAIEVLPKRSPRTRRIDLDDPPRGVSVLVDDDGTAWNDHWPVRKDVEDST